MRFLTCAALCSLIASVVAQVDTSVFYDPPTSGANNDFTANEVFTLGSTQTLKWSTQYSVATLIIWQNDNSNYNTLKQFNNGEQSYDWLVQTGYDLANGAVFFFQMYNGNTGEFFSSHYFNVTAASTSLAATATSSSLASSKSATSTVDKGSPASAASSADVTSGAATAKASSSTSSSGLSTVAKAGIGIALTVSALAVITGLFLLIRRRRAVRQPLQEKPPFHPELASSWQQTRFSTSISKTPLPGTPAPVYSPRPVEIGAPQRVEMGITKRFELK